MNADAIEENVVALDEYVAPIEGDLTIHEESLHFLEEFTKPEGLQITDEFLREFVTFVHRVSKATKPPDKDGRVTVEPVGKSPWDWIASKNIRLMQACSNEGAASAIMDMLRGMEVWANDRNTTLEYVDVAECSWTVDGRLIISFKLGEDA